ncbi:hypothetical protein [Streptomyces sp. NPDC058255]|uniref:hypothetical protein n=1 Tax=Streptomyces sp. NPDC058255 TaxID=3346407 RepID=UPI0036E3FDCA
MNNVGVLLYQHGETEQARAWYQRAADAGDHDAANLGALLLEQRDAEEGST